MPGPEGAGLDFSFSPEKEVDLRGPRETHLGDQLLSPFPF
jgi:hypothetical protein